MRKMLFSALAISLLLLSSATPSSAEEYTMEQAVKYALKTNPSINSRLLMLQQARMNVGTSASYFLPRVSIMSGYNIIRNQKEVRTGSSDDLSNTSRSLGLRVTMSLFAGFAHLNSFQKSRLTELSEEMRLRQAEHELACNIQLQFLQLLGNRENLKSAQKTVERLTTQLKAAQAFADVGMAPYANVLQNKTELSRAQQQVIKANNDIKNAEAQLNAYLGIPPEHKVTYVGKLNDYGVDVGYNESEAIAVAVKQRPDLQIAQKAIEMADKDIDIREGEYLPRVDANWDITKYHRSYRDDDYYYSDYTRRYWSAGINFSWEFFSGGSTTFGLLGDKKRAAAVRKDYDNAVTGARTEVIRALLDIQSSRELITTARLSVESATENYAMANQRYLSGVGTIIELLDAQVRLSLAETDASDALTQFQAARARFFFYIGKENLGLF